jgi:hypothetical protein
MELESAREIAKELGDLFGSWGFQEWGAEAIGVRATDSGIHPGNALVEDTLNAFLDRFGRRGSARGRTLREKQQACDQDARHS